MILQKVLSQYLAEPENLPPPLKIATYSIIGTTVSCAVYRLFSQHWPKQRPSSEPWFHRIEIYSPDYIHAQTAILAVAGGWCHPPWQQSGGLSPNMYAQLAEQQACVVIVCRDVPNQCIRGFSGELLAEDALISDSFKQFLQNPKMNYYAPLQLAMAKVVSKTMDFAQHTLGRNIAQDFMLFGSSKRAWAAWLAAVIDKRVIGLLAMAMDCLNLNQSLQHVYEFYGQQWPAVYQPYIDNGFLSQLNDPIMHNLETIVDPLQYLKPNHPDIDTLHVKKLKKSVLSASGDALFPPDISEHFFSQIPGECSLRYIANCNHHIPTDVVISAVVSLYEKIKRNQTMSYLKWQHSSSGIHISCEKRPCQVLLWYAENANAKTFCFTPDSSKNSQYQYRDITADFQKNHHKVSIDKPKIVTGYCAYFIECHFLGSNNVTHIETTDIKIFSHLR